ncbi:MAG: M14 family metallopeptidase [Candidatus Aminicenantes bacterium]|nr:M14 family metallopeptidase [Candidatus Aminicenantes bacterium]
MRHSSLCAATVLTIVVVGLSLGAGEPPAGVFRIGSLTVNPGQSLSGYLDIPPRQDEGTTIPLTVIHGLLPGPVVACVAGVHGCEYPPILALYRLRTLIDPLKLAGTVILVHIANVPSFARRTVYYTPADWKNLNRVFPGSPDGTLSQRIAFVLNEEVVGRCDVLLDLHGGDANEALMPYTYWMIGDDPALNAKSRDLALAFGLRHIIIDATRTRDLTDSKYLGNTAILRGKAAITTETGALGRTDVEYIDMAERGILGVMRHLGMIEGRAEPVANPVWIDDYIVLNSGTTGLFTSLVKMGQNVAAGDRVGFVSDYLGTPREDIRAPFAGLVLYVIGTPPTSRGEPLIELGHIKE